MPKASGPRAGLRAGVTSHPSSGSSRKAGPGDFLFSGVEALGRAPGYGAPRAALRGLLGAALGQLGRPRASLTLRLVSGEESRSLNRRFRGLDRSTDILSFPSSAKPPAAGLSAYLGDLAFCPPYAWRRRGRFCPDHGEECARLLLHGLLHLVGLHHESPAQERRQAAQARRLEPLARRFAPSLRRLGPLEAA